MGDWFHLHYALALVLSACGYNTNTCLYAQIVETDTNAYHAIGQDLNANMKHFRPNKSKF